MKISIGPVLFDWGKEKLYQFYQQMAFETPADRLYIGEVVCSKRQQLSPQEMANLIETLKPSGKELIISTLGLVMSNEEQETIHELAQVAKDLEIKIEANDMAGVSVAENKKVPFIAGPHINIYNPETILFLQELGATGVVFPVELPKAHIQGIIDGLPKKEGLERELFVYGKIPLTFSARCYTARAFELSKANCQFKCGEFPDGLPVDTLENSPILTINGVQMMSNPLYNLIESTQDLQQIGLTTLRLSPSSQGMDKVIDLWSARLAKKISSEEAFQALKENAATESFCNGYFLDNSGLSYQPPNKHKKYSDNLSRR
ncbi:U32 family peptidase [Magnetococcales bacterium HHB-1]